MTSRDGPVKYINWGDFAIAECTIHENCIAVFDGGVEYVEEEDVFHMSSLVDRRELLKKLKELWMKPRIRQFIIKRKNPRVSR